MPNAPDTPEQVINKRFRLGKVLGRGPSGVVYTAVDLKTGQPCALKRLHSQYTSREILERVLRDATAAAQLSHPAIVALTSSGFEPGGAMYLVTPLASGESLLQRLSRGPLSLTATLSLLEPLCAALIAAHDVGLHHGALSPQNIMCAPSGGSAQLTDFGMCHLRQTPKIPWNGGMGYLAPETMQEDAPPCTARGDVFSIGALVFECLTGQRMFSATSPATFLTSMMAPPRLGTLLPQYEHLDAVLEMACTPEPQDRFANVGALWRALHSSLLELPSTVKTSPVPPAAESPKSPRQRRDVILELPRVESSHPVRSMPIIAGPRRGSEDRMPAPLPPPPPGPGGADAGQPNKRQSAPGISSMAPTAPMAPISASPPSGPIGSPPIAPRPPSTVTTLPPKPPVTRSTPQRPLLKQPDDLPPGHLVPLVKPERRRPPTDPQQAIPTDPGIWLRRPSRTARLREPLLWASLGGVVVGGAILLVQALIGPGPAQRRALNLPSLEVGAGRLGAELHIDSATEGTLLQAAEYELKQRNFHSALGHAELLLRFRPEHVQARGLADLATETLRGSATYGGFLRAADRQDADTAAALYHELPVGSSFRTQAWEPFAHVRALFVKRHLTLAAAAQQAGQCDEVRAQVEYLHWIADSEADPALLQGQRMLGKCKVRPGDVLAAEVSMPAETGSLPAPRRGERPPRPERVDRSDEFEKVDKPEKPRKSRKRNPAKEPGEGPADKPREPEKPAEEPPSMPKVLRNPFG